MRSLYLDCSFGIAGDMFLAALAALGLDLAPLQQLFAPHGALRIDCTQETRDGIVGRRLTVVEPQARHHRHLPEIAAIIEALDASVVVRRKSLCAFRRLAEAEAAVHGCPLEHVHFHELGAADTIVDVVGCFWGLEKLGIERVVSSPLPWFRGQTSCAHGLMPLPAPATTRLLHGKPVYPSNFDFECITPTGALLLDQIVDAYAQGPEGTLSGHGLGYGAKNSGGGLRVFLIETSPVAEFEQGASVERICVLESNVDHLAAEDLGHFFERLFDAGALDVFYSPGVMKKNRPAGVLQVMCKPADLEAVQRAFFKHSLTLGLRRSIVERVALQRKAATLETPFGPIRAKEFICDGQCYLRPESDALAALSLKTGLSVPELRHTLACMHKPD